MPDAPTLPAHLADTTTGLLILGPPTFASVTEERCLGIIDWAVPSADQGVENA